MTSERRIEANRRNAQKSTGPKTAEGKARSRRNAVKHGVLAETVIGSLEDRSAFQALHEELIDHFRPCSRLEEVLVERLAMALWRDRRLVLLEKELVYHANPRHRIKRVSDKGVEHYPPRPEATEHLLKLGRYAVMLTREIQRLMAMIEQEQTRSRRMIDVTPKQT